MKKRNGKAAALAVIIAAATLFSEFGGTISVNAEETGYTPVEVSDSKVAGFENENAALGMELYARYNSGALCADGGSMEIIEYNEINGYAYAVSGLKGQIVALPVKGVSAQENVVNLDGMEYDVKSLVESAPDTNGFIYGDVTSVAISPDGTMLAAAVQHMDYDKNGVVALFTCNADGSFTVNKLIPVGVQPDMVTFADNNTILTADEGEPRNGYGEGAVDPKGTVSIIKVSEGTSVQVGFENFTADELIAKNIIVGIANGEVLAPETDMEPEYIAVSSDGSKAYVALQEANAIAVLDTVNQSITDIYSVGFEDYSKVAVDIKEDGTYDATTYENLVGARMPDGIAVYNVNGTDYLVTANEGDSRDWNGYCNEEKTKNFTGKKIRILDPSLCAGLPDGTSVMFGGRGFTVFEIGADGLSEVFDSGSQFEEKTAQYLPSYFNASNDDTDVDSRSVKKGPEPENVTIGQVAGRTYAFVVIERIGGIMVYDVTEPAEAFFVNYINSRDFTSDIKGDVSPEGICFIADNGNGIPVIATACEVSGTVAFYALSAKQSAGQSTEQDIVLLYTNDVHNAYQQTVDANGNVTCLGYAAVAQYKKDMEAEGNYVELIDAGDAIQGGVIGALSNGSYLVDIMNKTGYTLAVPGNHEFDFGMDTFLNLANTAEYPYISCNFVDLRTGEPVFDGYEIRHYGDTDVAYIGITTPETFTKSTPTFFQDENGTYIYGFCEGNQGLDLYAQVQKNIDAAKAEGADYVIAVGHIGTDASSSPWTSKEIIENTTGLDAFLDGHSHSTIPSEVCTDKNGEEVLLTSTGTKLSSIGKLVISADGNVTSELITDAKDQDADTLAYVNEITEKFDALQNQVVAVSEVELVVNDPATGKRMVRNQETNLGDLCADAYRSLLGADVAFVNGGGVRAAIKQGDVTYGDVISVHPFGNLACLIEASGQEILDALELGASAAGVGESGGFLQVSGLTYEIDTTIPSSVVKDEKGAFVKVDGAYRVKNVMVGGKPLDLTKTYTLASHNYMLKSGGDGYSMFIGNKILKDEVMVDNQVLIRYIADELNGTIKADSIYADPYGEGRICVITAYQAPTADKEGYVEYLQGSETVREVLAATGTGSGNTNTGSGNANTGSSNQTTIQATIQTEAGSKTVQVNEKNAVAVMKEAIHSIANNGSLHMMVENPAMTLSVDVFAEAGRKNISVELDCGTYSWKFHDIPENPAAGLTSAEISIGKKVEEISSLLDATGLSEDEYYTISFAHDGALPSAAEVTLNVSQKYEDGAKLYFYYYNEKENEFEEIARNLSVINGCVTVEISHCSDYILTENELPQKVRMTGTQTVNTGDETPYMAAGILMVFAALLLGSACYVEKKKKHMA